MTLPGDTLQAAPTAGQDDVVPFLEGLAAIDEIMVMVLDLHALSASGAHTIAA